MTDTANLALPCIEGSQAQKHVTHNDALRILDTLVQLAVLDRDLTVPPGSPAEGQRWIVKTGATGTWAGHVNAIAAWQDGAWIFSAPQTGWVAYVADEGTLLVWNGAAWGDFFSTVTSIQNLVLLGVGTTADSTNVLSAKLNNALFAAKTTTEGGNGDLRYKLSKAAAGNTLSFLFQDNYSGRAEVGLTGDDDFHFKVSPDGTTWIEGIRIAAATGKVSFPVSGGPRETLGASRTYYVRTDGNDGNSGLANSSGGAFLTIQKAVDTVANGIDLAGCNVTIQVGNGTYTGTIVVLAPWVGVGNVTLLGDITTPSNVLLNVAGSAITVGVTPSTTGGSGGARLYVGGFKITATGTALVTNEGSLINIIGKMEYGACNNHLLAQRFSSIYVNADYTISGNANTHWSVSTNGSIVATGRTITLSASPVFSGGFAKGVRQSRIICNSNTFSGAAGTSSLRYALATMGLIDTSGAGATYLPGDTAGSNDGTGMYN